MSASTNPHHHHPNLVEGDFFPLLDEEENPANRKDFVDSCEKHAVVQRRSKKKVSWADESLSESIVNSLAEFYLPVKTSSPITSRPAVAAVPSQAAIYKERENGDGERYLFFPAQRPSARLLAVRAAEKGNVDKLFPVQPGSPRSAETLFWRMHPRRPPLNRAGAFETASLSRGLPMCPAMARGPLEGPAGIPSWRDQ